MIPRILLSPMRRPFCVMALIFAAAIFLLLLADPPAQPSYESLDGSKVRVTGMVSGKEFHTAADGTVTLLVSLRQVQWADEVRDSETETRPKTGQIRESEGDSPADNRPTNGRQADGKPADNRPTYGRTPDFSPSDSRPSIPDGVLLSLDTDPAALYRDDDRIPVGALAEVSGTLRSFQEATNPGEFDSRLYYQTLKLNFRLNHGTVHRISGSRHPLQNALHRTKRRLAAVLDACLATEDAAVLKAMLLGEKGFLSAELKALYRESGIIHILAISGLHVTLLGMGFFRVLRRLRMPLLPACALAAAFMLLYGGMTGIRGSGVRAICMFLVHLGAKLLRRTYDLLTAAALAAILLLIDQPLYLWNSGFLFSFGAVLGIGILMPLFRSPFLKALAIPVWTMPVYLWFYGTFPLYSLLLNLAVIPLMSVVMTAGIVVTAAGGLWPAAGRAAGIPCHVLLYFYRAACELTAGLPGHRLILGRPYPWEIILFYGLLAGATIFALRVDRLEEPESDEEKIRRTVSWRNRRKAVLEMGKGLFLAAAVLVLCWRNHRGLELHFLDVGQGDGIYLQADGTSILIDGGSSSKASLGQYQLEPFLLEEGAGHLDLAVLTHDDSDHANGLIWLLEKGYDIRMVGMADFGETPEERRGENERRILELCRARHIPVIYLREGSVIQPGRRENGIRQNQSRQDQSRQNRSRQNRSRPQLTITCVHPSPEHLHPDDINQDSISLFVTYDRFSAMLTGDLEEDGEEKCLRYLQQNGLPESSVTVLKAGHHGSRYATSAAWLRHLRPQFSVISCGRKNRYGHPAAETLSRIRDAGAEILDTRYTGEIAFYTDGRSVRVRTFLGN